MYTLFFVWRSKLKEKMPAELSFMGDFYIPSNLPRAVIFEITHRFAIIAYFEKAN